MELLSLKDVCTNSWVICGDFNCIKNQSERKGLPWSRKAMALFSDLINNLEVIDLPLSNQTYTWSNMQQRPTLAKLDRFLVSTEWDLSFPIARSLLSLGSLLTTPRSFCPLVFNRPREGFGSRKSGLPKTTSCQTYLAGGMK